jgi:hypothetical protein
MGPKNASVEPHAEVMTPLLLGVQDAPIPFLGSDGQIHLVYELWVTNFSAREAVVETAAVVGDDKILETLDGAAVANRLQPAGRRDTSATMAPSTQALLFLHVVLPARAAIPRLLSHRISVRVAAAPPGQEEIRESGGETPVAQRDVVVIGPPLRGERFISADSCCDASRHTRAALPVNGRVYLAQRRSWVDARILSLVRVLTGLPDRSPASPSAHRSAASAPVSARAPRAAKRPPLHKA